MNIILLNGTENEILRGLKRFCVESDTGTPEPGGPEELQPPPTILLMHDVEIEAFDPN